MAETARGGPELPDYESTVPKERRAAAYIVEHTFSDSGDTVEPLAPLARAYIESAGQQAVTPSRAYGFIKQRILDNAPETIQAELRAGAVPQKYLPLLPEQRVMRHLQDEVIPADRAVGNDRIRQQNRDIERHGYIRKSILHHPLPEDTLAIQLQVQLRSIGRRSEADAISVLLEAYGRTINGMPFDSPILWRARLEREKRNI